MTPKNPFDTTELERKIIKEILDFKKLKQIEKGFLKIKGVEWELFKPLLEKTIQLTSQRFGAIVKKDWIEKKEVGEIIDKCPRILGKAIDVNELKRKLGLI